jgi:ABC-type polysaccharide/polyol phosphate export permease
MKVIVFINPLSYAVDAMRATLINQSHFGLTTNFFVMGITLIVLFGVSVYKFKRIEV